MRCFRAVLVLFAALFCGSALADPDDYVFEFRLIEDDGREIVATCRGRAPCILDERLRGEIGMAVQVDVTPAGISIGVMGDIGALEVRDAAGFDIGSLLTRGPGRWIAVAELPATLRITRYGPAGPCLRNALCERTEKIIGSGTLVVRPLRLAPPRLGDRT